MIRRDRYLALDERKICEVRRHPALLLGIGLRTLAVFLAAGALGMLSSPARSNDVIDTILGLIALVFFLRFLWAVVQWWVTRIIVTDRRIVEVSGVVSRRVASMPLPQVTDTTYHRSILGRLLGYGDLVVESPGRHPGLSHLGYVPRPDDFYRIVMSLMNASSGDAPDDVVVSQGDDDTGEIPRVVLENERDESIWG
jgi:Bacterial PH domain